MQTQSIKRIWPTQETIEERFWRSVDKRGPDDCWLWTKGVNKQGYGQFSYRSKHYFTHVFSYVLHHGPLATGPMAPGVRRRCVCHSCDVRRCVNPAHLWYGTQSDNMKDAFRKGRLKTPQWVLDRMAKKRIKDEQRLLAKVERIHRYGAGLERPRDTAGRFQTGHRDALLQPRVRDGSGRFESGLGLPPRRRDERGFFLPSEYPHRCNHMTDVRRDVLRFWQAHKDIHPALIARDTHHAMGHTVNALRWLVENGYIPTEYWKMCLA